nr:uncharacterized protein LOC114925514 [Arachis hypogaea]
MQIALLPNYAWDKIDYLTRQFLWKEKASGKGLPLIKWEVVTAPKGLGGLRVKGTQCTNLSLFATSGLAIFQEFGRIFWKLITSSKMAFGGVLEVFKNQHGMIIGLLLESFVNSFLMLGMNQDGFGGWLQQKFIALEKPPSTLPPKPAAAIPSRNPNSLDPSLSLFSAESQWKLLLLLLFHRRRRTAPSRWRGPFLFLSLLRRLVALLFLPHPRQLHTPPLQQPSPPQTAAARTRRSRSRRRSSFVSRLPLICPVSLVFGSLPPPPSHHPAPPSSSIMEPKSQGKGKVKEEEFVELVHHMNIFVISLVVFFIQFGSIS